MKLVLHVFTFKPTLVKTKLYRIVKLCKFVQPIDKIFLYMIKN